MGKVVIKAGSQQEMQDIEDRKHVILQIIQKHRSQLEELQESLVDLERRLTNY